MHVSTDPARATLRQFQESRLRAAAFASGDSTALMFYLAASRRLDAVAQLAAVNQFAQDQDELLANVLLDDVRDTAAAIAIACDESAIQWTRFALTKLLVRAGQIRDASELAKAALLLPAPDVAPANILAQWALSEGEPQLGRAFAEASLATNPQQTDMAALFNDVPRRQSVSLDPLPPSISLSYYLPAYNVEEYIRLALDGAFELGYPLNEVLVIDDGTPDASIEIAKTYPVRILRHVTNQGLAAARNTAFATATSEWVMTVDTDAYPDPTYMMAASIEFDLGSPTLAGIRGRFYELHTDTPADAWRAHHMAQHSGDSRVVPPVLLFGANTLFKRDAVIRSGGYDPRYRTNGEDGAICRALAENGYSIAYTPHAHAYHARRDTVPSVLTGMWRWAFHHREERGDYSSRGRLLASFESVADTARIRFEDDAVTQRHDLLRLDAMFLLQSILLDLAHACECGLLSNEAASAARERLLATVAPDVANDLNVPDRICMQTAAPLDEMVARAIDRATQFFNATIIERVA